MYSKAYPFQVCRFMCFDKQSCLYRIVIVHCDYTDREYFLYLCKRLRYKNIFIIPPKIPYSPL